MPHLFQQSFNDKAVIVRCLVQYWQIFSSFHIFFNLFHSPKRSWNNLQNMRNLVNIFPYGTRHRVITTTCHEQAKISTSWLANESPILYILHSQHCTANIALCNDNKIITFGCLITICSCQYHLSNNYLLTN